LSLIHANCVKGKPVLGETAPLREHHPPIVSSPVGEADPTKYPSPGRTFTIHLQQIIAAHVMKSFINFFFDGQRFIVYAVRSEAEPPRKLMLN